MARKCAICGATAWSVYYEGPIRVGEFGSLSRTDHTVWRCDGCEAAWLEGGSIDYQSDDYRQLVDKAAGSEAFYTRHDAEQGRRLAMVGPENLRGKVVMDVGCGGGSFLDLARGVARETLAVEPTRAFHADLAQNGHQVFSYCAEVDDNWLGRVDLAVCFSVIEHVEDPLALLSDIRRLLTPGGRLLLSTPNREDWLLELLPTEYGSFFYRLVHRWYFNAVSLANLGSQAGFSRVKPFFEHRFDLSNLLVWCRDRRPSGTSAILVPAVLDAAFRESLVVTGRADYLYAWLHA